MHLRHIIFDIGNVLLNFKPREYLKGKINDERIIEEVCREVFESEEWLMLDRGVITEEAAKNILAERSKRNGSFVELAFKDWYDALTPIEGTIDILKKLKSKGYKIYYLSNFHLLAFREVCKRNDFFSLFDGGVVSFEENLIKPEDEIYIRVIEKCGFKPEEALFIDDSPVNIEAARKFDFNTILFKNPGDLKDKLMDYNINV